jgi:hypothetical protein
LSRLKFSGQENIRFIRKFKILNGMAKKKNNMGEEIIDKKKGVKDSDEESVVGGEDSAIDPAIIEDTFTEEFSEYNDVDNF